MLSRKLIASMINSSKRSVGDKAKNKKPKKNKDKE